ncbi:MAG: tetratricopeptide repeat protein [Cyanobacteriota/Melainabacteria group bacterium]|nr:tetratricopeptide repeat protein [Cyanobacteria bacterium HKST-UBA01]MCB9470972.1 tetratricopeptide repeat protein [Candidatus Obscuribacterales bacterium]
MFSSSKDREKKQAQVKELIAKASEISNQKGYDTIKSRAKEAISLLEKAVALDKSNQEARANLALNLSKADRFQEAESIINRLIDEQPQEALIWNLLGESLLYRPMGHFEALVLFNNSLSFEKTPAGWRGVGDALLKLGEFQQMADAYAQWCILDPDNSEAWYQRGKALNFIKETEQAISAFRNAVRLQPDYSLAYKELTHGLGKLGRYEDALAICDQWETHRPKNRRLWYYRGYILYKMNRPRSAIQTFEKALELVRSPNSIWSDLGDLYYSLEIYEQSLFYRDKYSRAEKCNYRAWLATGDAATRVGQFEKALESYEKALKTVMPGDPINKLSYSEGHLTVCMKGKGLTNNGAIEEARLLWTEIEANAPAKPVFAAGRAYTIRAISGIDKALASVTELTSEDLNLESTYRYLTDFLIDVKAWDEAVLVIRKLMDCTENKTPVKLEEARLLAKAGHFQEALSIVEKVISDKNRHSRAYFEMASIQCQAGDPEKSIEALKKAIEIKPSLKEVAYLSPLFDKMKADPNFEALVN